MSADYERFLSAKSTTMAPSGIEVAERFSERLFPFQRDIVKWALRRGRAAIFADCGMGKTPMQLEWAHHVHRYAGASVLILAPLAVAQQTVREGNKFEIAVRYVRDPSEMSEAGIYITNYEMLPKFDANAFGGIVLDESSILKAYDGKTRTAIIEAFQETPFRLACTATPAPNDFMELGNHAEFLGAMTRPEMLSMFFVHDGGSTQDWRLKGHAEDAFWKWVCQWAVMIRKPSDLEYDDADFVLPPLEMHEHIVETDHSDARKSGLMFAMEAHGLQEQRAARRASMDKRVAKCAELVNASKEPWIVWCELNAEGDALEEAIDGAVQVAGADSNEDKESRMIGFANGTHRILVTKCSVAGFGMNFQICPNVAFVGASNSYEQFYQAVRRVYRFGQKRPVHCHVIIASTEGRVVANLKRKEDDARRMAEAMVGHMRDIQKGTIRGLERDSTAYQPTRQMVIPKWLQTEVDQ